MDENCHVEPIYKTIPMDQMHQADRVLLAVRGMGCQNCAMRVRNGLLSLEGVYAVDVYLNMGLAEVRYDRARASIRSLTAAVARAGNDGRHEYRVELIVNEA